MHKVKIMDINQEQQFLKKGFRNKRKATKTIKIDDGLFEIALRKGLIEKNKDGYYFIGDAEELLAFKNKKLSKSFGSLD